jgi:hypothetical protein
LSGRAVLMSSRPTAPTCSSDTAGMAHRYCKYFFVTGLLFPPAVSALGAAALVEGGHRLISRSGLNKL